MKTTIKTLILLLFSLSGFSQEIEYKAWIEDLDAYQIGLEDKHIDLFNKIDKVEFIAELNKIKETLTEKSDLETTLELMRLTRRIGDGHTAISTRNLDYQSYPIEVRNFGGDWRIVKVAIEYNDLLGMKLESIDGVSINLISKKVGEVAQFVENQHSQIIRTGENLTSAEILYGLKITTEKNQANFTFSDDKDKMLNIRLKAISKQAQENESIFSRLEIAVPEIQKPGNPTYDYFWYAPIEGTNGLYIHFEGYPKFEEMMKLSEEIVAYSYQNNINQLVIDLRNNGGGDLYIGLVLANALNLADPVDWKSGVYVLCDNVTFSAATSNVALFRELLNAKIIGEPTGSNPSGYQDMDTFQLPNSKLVVCYSKRFFQIQETSTSGVQPDYFIHYEWDSYLKGKDNMLEWVVSQIKTK